MTPISSVPPRAYAWPQPCRSAGYWPPDPNNFPPWLEKRGDWLYCCACWKYADNWHVLTAEHFRRVWIWDWRQKQHSIAFPTVRAETWPSTARSPTKSADSGSVCQSDLAELRELLHAGQRSAWAKRVPSDMPSAADRTDGETVSHNDLADLLAFLNAWNTKQASSAVSTAAMDEKPPTQSSPPRGAVMSRPAASWNPAGAAEPFQFKTTCVEQTVTQFQISTPPIPPQPLQSSPFPMSLPPHLISPPIAAAAAAAAAAGEKPPIPAPYLAAASPPAAGLVPTGSEESQQVRMTRSTETPTPFQAWIHPQPPPPRQNSTLLPPPPPLPHPHASTSATESTAGSDYLLQHTQMRFVDQMPTTGSNSTGHFRTYNARLTYEEGNVSIEYMRNGQRTLAVTMPADEATRLAAALTELLQLAWLHV